MVYETKPNLAQLKKRALPRHWTFSTRRLEDHGGTGNCREKQSCSRNHARDVERSSTRVEGRRGS